MSRKAKPIRNKILKDISLKAYNSFGVEASSRKFVIVDNFHFLDTLNLKSDKSFFILGEGSNVLFTKNFEGLILKISFRGKKIIEEDTHSALAEVSAGENWDDFVEWSVQKNLCGVENLSLIPGSVGASPIQNIGAYGCEVSEVIDSVVFYDFQTKTTKNIDKVDCQFDYRKSIFKQELKNKGLILKVRFRLSKKFEPNMNYADVISWFKKKKLAPSLQSMRKAIIDIRSKKLPDIHKTGNAGSFFKNPTINKSNFLRLKKDFEAIKFYQLSDNTYKIPAAWLIEQTIEKGYRKADYGVWKNQPLVLCNFGNATGEEIYNFSEEIVQSVFQKFGIRLEREVNIL